MCLGKPCAVFPKILGTKHRSTRGRALWDPQFLWDATAIAEVGEPDEVESWRDNSRSGSGVLRVKTSQIISEADRGSIHLTARGTVSRGSLRSGE